MRRFRANCISFCCHLVTILCLTSACYAQSEEELQILQLFYKDNDLVVTPSRYPKSISKVAENITIITAEDIKSINAHTLPDVLLNVTGLQTNITGGPGSIATVQVQGSDPRQVLVIIDGVIQNNLSDGVADIGSIPVQNIERIEIVKGPASSTWGSSLGGVINIITKSPDDSRTFGGTASASIGNRNTGDYRTEVSGKKGCLGYYLNGGGLTSDGLVPHNSIYSGNLYSKFSWTPSEKTDLVFSLGYTKGKRGIGENLDLSFDNHFENLFSSVSLNHSFSDELSIDASLKFMDRDNNLTQTIFVAAATQEVVGRELNYGGSVRLVWEHALNQLLIGTDFDLGHLDTRNIFKAGQDLVKSAGGDLNRFAFYANDTLTLGKLTFVPGIRYDYTSTNGDFVSPSMGITCTVTKDTILRGYVARGFNIPPLGSTFGTGFFSIPNPDLKMEEVLSYSAGFETAELKYVWLKTTFFRHDIDDVLTRVPVSPTQETTINGGKQRRQGVEVEARTMPIFDTSLVAGYAFVEAKDRQTGATIVGIPRYTVDVGLQYDDNKSFKGNLKGHYIWWNSPSEANGRYTAMIWDLNLAKAVFTSGKRAVGIFFTAHNIFNGSQYPLDVFKNPKRWFEGGVRFDF